MENELKRRMSIFAMEVMTLVDDLPKTSTGSILGKQLLRCATSVGANYRAACRAKSKADFIAKLAIVEEEADETMYWLDLLLARNLISKDNADRLSVEANEFVAIMVSSIKTVRLSNQSGLVQNLDSKIKNQMSPSSSLA